MLLSSSILPTFHEYTCYLAKYQFVCKVNFVSRYLSILIRVRYSLFRGLIKGLSIHLS